MSTIDFSHLRLLAIFATVVDNGSFAAAARRLNSSRSRISEQVAVLESSLGTRLLQRSTRQLKITDEGKLVYEQAKQLTDILDQVESAVTPALPRGRVAITMPHDIAHKFMLPVLKDFRQRYPEIQLDLIPDDSRVNLIGEQIDLAIRVGIPKDESIIARVMHEERLALFVSPDYLDHAGSLKTLKDLEKCHWILLNQLDHGGVQHLRKNGKTVEIRPTTFYRCDSPLLVQKMVIEGLGIGSLLPSSVEQEIDSGQLLRIFPSLSSELLVFSLVYPSRRQVPQRVRALIDYLLEKKIFTKSI
ncbi:LysR family transcriptional regulator [Granulosicoccus antarcticus]|uniref:HTH-type transcriptional regulator DmlR n=1 Tax=Granulosicoccus antarcticus IMCC3135 TaxID=1192854 RepID=A0A2Z2NWD9_9GAMM|nr:LysR family transcriptional regulator [Granulosicoccus antarcticus]ASJ74815.1 HTH-type transcriptional regulator DmlR [Granulosicoccus antarcticus IMCC3135]